MEGSYADKYCFIGQWYDEQANLVRKFSVCYYPTDDTVEMRDIMKRKKFVRRNKVDGVTLDKFYIGSTVQIFGRSIKILDFGCEDTRKRIQNQLEKLFVLIKPMPYSTAGKIIKHLNDNGFNISNMKMAIMTSDDIKFLYADALHTNTFPFEQKHLNDSFVCGLELVAPNIFENINKIVGASDPAQAEPGTIRALYGTDQVRNCVHISSSPETVLRDLEYFFTPPGIRVSHLNLTATLSNCTLCIVKPHAIREGKLGPILADIDDGGFDITALTMMYVETINAAEFYEVYKGLVAEYKGMVDELASGSCVAMEIVAKNRSVCTAVEFRKLVGPADPDIARLLRPNTLRAKHGVNKVHNAVHCSDLPEDGLLEVEYFFKILNV